MNFKEYKKEIVLSIIILILLLIVILLYCSNKNDSYPKELSNNDKVMIVEKAFQNYAWGFQYNGAAIFNDGTIYKWDVEGNKIDYKISDYERTEDWIFENGKKINKRVTDSDLKIINENIENLSGDYEPVNKANDAGSSYIKVLKDGKMVKIKESGDFTGENKSSSAQKIIQVISKYLK